MYADVVLYTYKRWRNTMLDITLYTANKEAKFVEMTPAKYARLGQALRMFGPFQRETIQYRFDNAEASIEVLCIDEKLRFVLAVTLIDELSKPEIDQLSDFIYLEV
jgi:hypothetical protein